ncbi:MAG: hypothetical protein ABR903_07835 [Thermodesulfovibrionales bacterium]|jgi:hypothetical protein
MKSSGSNKEKDAKALLKSREGSIVDGKFNGLRVERILFDELTEDLLNDYRINARKSLKRIELSVKHLKEYFSGAKAINITTGEIQKYILKRQGERVENGTINTYGIKEGLYHCVETNPSENGTCASYLNA